MEVKEEKDRYARFAEVLKKIPPIIKNAESDVKLKTGGGYKHQYADLDNLISNINPILLSHGFFMTQARDFYQVDIEGGRLSDKLIPIFYTKIIDIVSRESVAESRDIWPEGKLGQEAASLQTFFRRQHIEGLFNIAAKDDDGNIESANSYQGKTKEFSTARNDRPTAPKSNPHPPSSTTQSRVTPPPAPQKNMNNPADFIITFGKKFNGMRLGDLSQVEAKNYLDYLVAATNKEGKPLGSHVKALQTAYNQLYKE